MTKGNQLKGGISLFWKLSATFLVLLVLVGIMHIVLSISASEKYYQERNQRLNANIAESIIKEVKPTFIDGQVQEEAMDDIMHHMMAVNPSIEVYLLDTEGKILNHVAPYKKVKLTQVSLDPVYEFLDTQGQECVLGDDPRKPGEEQIFSAAPIMDGEELQGYVYVVLAGEEYFSVASNLWSDYITTLGGGYYADDTDRNPDHRVDRHLVCDEKPERDHRYRTKFSGRRSGGQNRDQIR